MRPVGRGDFDGGGAGNTEENLVTFSGRVVSAAGSGKDSIKVTLSRGSVDRRAAGRSAGEQPTITCRRCEFAVKNERFSV